MSPSISILQQKALFVSVADAETTCATGPPVWKTGNCTCATRAPSHHWKLRLMVGSRQEGGVIQQSGRSGHGSKTAVDLSRTCWDGYWWQWCADILCSHPARTYPFEFTRISASQGAGADLSRPTGDCGKTEKVGKNFFSISIMSCSQLVHRMQLNLHQHDCMLFVWPRRIGLPSFDTWSSLGGSDMMPAK